LIWFDDNGFQEGGAGMDSRGAGGRMKEEEAGAARLDRINPRILWRSSIHRDDDDGLRPKSIQRKSTRIMLS
jgi:hypothetical protein